MSECHTEVGECWEQWMNCCPNLRQFWICWAWTPYLATLSSLVIQSEGEGRLRVPCDKSVKSILKHNFEGCQFHLYQSLSCKFFTGMNNFLMGRAVREHWTVQDPNNMLKMISLSGAVYSEYMSLDSVHLRIGQGGQTFWHEGHIICDILSRGKNFTF